MGGQLQFDQQVVEALEEGLLSPSEAAEALSGLLANYDAPVRADILNRLLRFGLEFTQADRLVDSRALTVSPFASRRSEPPQPTRDRLVQRLLAQDVALLTLEDRRLRSANLNLTYLRSRNALILLVQEGSVTVPDFQFRLRGDAAVARLSVRRCNASLLAGDDPWGALSWWVSANGYLAGRTPIALLGSSEEEQLAALAESMTATA